MAHDDKNRSGAGNGSDAGGDSSTLLEKMAAMRNAGNDQTKETLRDIMARLRGRDRHGGGGVSRDLVLLCDISGSMDEPIELDTSLMERMARSSSSGATPGNVVKRTKWDALQEVVANVKATVNMSGFNVKMAWFNNDVSFDIGTVGTEEGWDGTVRVGPNGGTNMQVAFTKMKANGFTDFVLVTDGQPTSPEDETLLAADGCTISTLYVGPQPMPEFLNKLAARVGGTVETGDLKMLEETVGQILALGTGKE